MASNNIKPLNIGSKKQPKKDDCVLVVYPCDGEPYIVDEIFNEDDDNAIFLLQACVHGWVEKLDNDYIVAHTRIPKRGVEVYINEEARKHECYKPNKHFHIDYGVSFLDILGDVVVILKPFGTQKYAETHREFLEGIKTKKQPEYTFDNFECFRNFIGEDVVDKDEEGWKKMWEENHKYIAKETPEERAKRIFKEDEEIQKKREEDDLARLADVALKIGKILNSRKKTLKKIEDIQELHKSYGYGEMRTKELIPVFQENPDMDCALVEAILQWFK